MLHRKKHYMNIIEQVIEHFGSGAALSRQLGTSEALVSQVRNGQYTLSIDNALKIEELTYGKFKAESLCERLHDILWQLREMRKNNNRSWSNINLN